MIPEIDQNTFAARIADGDAGVLDVREPREYRPGHVPGAEERAASGCRSCCRRCRRTARST